MKSITLLLAVVVSLTLISTSIVLARPTREVVKLADLVKFSYNYHRRAFFRDVVAEGPSENDTMTEFFTETEVFTETETTETDAEFLTDEEQRRCVADTFCFENDTCPMEVTPKCCDYLSAYEDHNCTNSTELLFDCGEGYSVLDFFLEICAVRVNLTTHLFSRMEEFDENATMAFIDTLAELAEVNTDRITIISVSSRETSNEVYEFTILSETLVNSFFRAARFHERVAQSQDFTNLLNSYLSSSGSDLKVTRSRNNVVIENDPYSASATPSIAPSPSAQAA